MKNLETILPLLIDFFQNERNIIAVYLFGSYNDGTAHQHSDLDLAVLFNADIDLWTELALQAKLSAIAGFEAIDLLNLNKAPLRMKFTVIATGRLIYESNPNLTSDFLEQVLHLYHDREYCYKQFFKEWDEGLKEDYLNDQSR